jgi:predicted MPP superfamily phosphohydrolase
VTKTVILRFRDVEADTVELHEECVRSAGATWWAWWKKESEEFPESFLRALTSHGASDIGLINRQTDARYLARCERVAVAQLGERLSSPEPGRTPEYYRGDSFPAWFLLSRIERVTSEEWDRRFGGVPEGEPTLFIVPLDDPDAALKELQEKYAAKRVEINNTAILHISDLHFGTDYGFPVLGRSVPTPKRTLDEAIESGLRAQGVKSVGLVVVSGDLTTRGELEGLTAARQFLSALLERLNLRRDQIVIVPGNHDILLNDPRATRNYAAEVPFRDFLHLVYHQENLELNRLHWFSCPEEQRDILALALNSVRPREMDTMEYGYVGRDLYGPLLEAARGLREDIEAKDGRSPLLLAVLHHHVLPTPLIEEPESSRPISLTLDAGQLIEDLQAAGCDAILHGHQHVPFVGSTSRARRVPSGKWAMSRSVHVIGGGSCSVKMDRLWDNMRNNALGLYRPVDDNLSVRMFQFSPTVDLHEYLNLTLELG